MIRACISADVFREVSNGKSGIHDAERSYASTPMSDILRDDHPFSVKPFLGHEFEDFAPALMQLIHSWKDDTVIPFAAAHGIPNTHDAIWQYYKSAPKQEIQFNRAMTGLDAMGVPALVQDVPWSSICSTVVDVGGGRGSLLAAILASSSTLTGVLMDLPSVIDQSQQLWAAQYSHLAGRISFVRGSFFDAGAVPRAAGAGRACFTSKVGSATAPASHAALAARSPRTPEPQPPLLDSTPCSPEVFHKKPALSAPQHPAPARESPPARNPRPRPDAPPTPR
jgi:hypothetical protein